MLLIDPWRGILEEVANYPTIHARRLHPTDVPAATELALEVGVHGLYVRNVLAVHPRLGSKAEIMAFESEDQLIGLAHFGERGNLLVLERRPGYLDPVSAASAILDARFRWRIALAPPSVVRELVAIGHLRTLVDRRQIYCRVTGPELVAELAVAHDGYRVRSAEKKDLEPLMQAALHLNQTDLHVDPWCVDRDWLKRSTKTRIRKRTTYVIGPMGKPMCKLDLGSRGPAGVVIEGVYTWPELRGRGLASALVAGVAAELLADYPQVCLHVAETNAPARRSYEKCGMVEVDSCQLMLRG